MDKLMTAVGPKRAQCLTHGARMARAKKMLSFRVAP